MATQRERYQLVEKIHESINSIIYRGINTENDDHVIVKFLKEKYLTQQGIIKYKREYEITHHLECDHVIKVLDLLKTPEMIAIVEEDIGGCSLRELMQRRQLSLEECLTYAVEVCKALSEIYQLGVMHKDIKPDNIIINPKTGLVKLIDFCFASTQHAEGSAIKPHQQIEGTLYYMSPEQTGRMNQLTDYRTDFYALGVSLYEMLTNRLPFASNDPLELIHAHIAKQPVSPYKLNKEIPKIVSDIVMKLLAKSANNRYQTAWGIQADLENCLRQLQSQKKISNFKLGQYDIGDRLVISHKLYGREEEIKYLQSLFYRTAFTESQFVMVTGYSGIGKTSLIHEVDRILTQHHGFFMQGKYDQYLQHLPYSGFVNAFKGLINYLLFENEARIKEWQEIIRSLLGADVYLVTDLIPSFKLLIGEINTPRKNHSISLTEKQFRLNQAFIKLLKIFSQKDHPIVLFLDDLQWIDNASLTLLKNIMLDKEINHLLFMGAYRSNEVNVTHPLAKTILSLAEDNIKLHRINLTSLDYKSVESFIADTLHRKSSEVASLTEHIMEKTAGNPFFIIQFLETLYLNKWLYLDLKTKQWEWDLNKIKEQNFTDNVIDFMIENLTKLPTETQALLSMAACLGNQFDLKNLAIYYERSLSDAYKLILPAVNAGYLLNTSGLQLSSDDLINSDLVAINLRFLHDHIQQAAYSLAKPSVIKRYHAKIAAYLLKNLTKDERDERLFEITNHMNLANWPMTPDNKKTWITTHVNAAIKAKESGAYESALWYLKQGMKYLSEESWQKDYLQTLGIYRNRIELEFINANFKETESIFKKALKHAKTRLDKINLHVIPITQRLFQGRIKSAIELDKKALELIGVKIPTGNELIKGIRREKLKLNKYLNNHTISDLVNLKPMTDPEKSMILWLFYKMGSAAHFEDKALEAYISLKMVNLCIDYGNDRFSIAAYFVYGHTANSYFGEYETSYQFSNLSLSLCDKYNELALKTAALFFQGLIMPWAKHLKHAMLPFEECYQLAISTGELEFGMYSITNRLLYMQCAGENLEKLFLEAKQTLFILNKYKYKIMAGYVMAQLLFIQNLRGSMQTMLEFKVDNQISEKFLTKLCEQPNFNIVKKRFDFYKGVAFYLYDRNKEALHYMEIANISDMHINVGHLIEAEYIFYYALVLIRALDNANESENNTYKQVIRSALKQLKIWSDNCAENFFCMFALVKAEYARASGKITTAIDFYNKAAQSAVIQGFIHHAALAHELQGKFWIKLGNKETAKVFIHNARNFYTEWGANAKVELMVKQYPELFSAMSVYANLLSTDKSESMSFSSSNLIVDLHSLLKSSQAISSEISLSKLIKKLLLVLVENMGGQRGVLLLKRNDQWYIEGEYLTKECKTINILNSIPLEASTDLPVSIIKSVIRSKEVLVIINAETEENFMNDDYVKNNNIKSLLCAPILIHNELIGIFYFENNLLAGAFTPDRLEVLNILSGQITISIENAKLYKSFEAFVPQEFLSILNKKNIIDIQPGDNVQRSMTIMFSDIRNFTSISELMTPKESFELVNQFLGIINPIIKSHGGFIDKYLGDGVMALFPDDPDAAIQAAIEMNRELAKFNIKQQKNSNYILKIGTGIHWGKLILGTVGDKERMNGTVISDAVNFASRLEGFTKFFDTSILISDTLLQRLTHKDEFATRFLGKVRAKGRRSEMMIHEVLDETDTKSLSKLKSKEIFSQALSLYLNKKLAEAIEKFQLVLTVSPDDSVAKMYLELASEYLKDGLNKWSGIVDILEK